MLRRPDDFLEYPETSPLIFFNFSRTTYQIGATDFGTF